MLRAMVILTLVVTTTSQPPSPTPASPAQEPKQQAGGEQNVAANNNQPSGKSPAAIQKPVAEVPARYEQYFAAQNQKEPSRPWWADYTADAVAFFTLMLAILAACQYCAMRQQARLMHIQARLMRRQLAEMKDALHAQRAYVVVEAFDIEDDGLWFSFKCAINNAGDTLAKITEAVTCWMVAKELPASPDYGIANRMEHPKLIVATDKPIRVQRSVEPEERARIAAALKDPGAAVGNPPELLYIYGRIAYDDAFGNHHVTGWARKFQGRRPTTQEARFAYQGNPAYDYAT